MGADHAGYAMKDKLKSYLEKKGVKVIDLGAFSADPVDYPVIAKEVAEKVVENAGARGLLICGTGQGMAMSANKLPGIRAALCEDTKMATLARQHNNANILCLGGRRITGVKAKKIVDVFLKTEFEGGRHEERVRKIG